MFEHSRAPAGPAAAPRQVEDGCFTRRLAPPRESDRGLIARAVVAAQSGDDDAVRFLYARYADNVYGYVCSIVRDDHEAEDVTQDVFLKLMRVIGQYRPREVPFLAWLLRISRNVAVDHMRRRRAYPFEEVRDPEVDLSDANPELAQTVHDALATLPPEQCEVVVLRHLAGLSPGEIAVRMGKTEGSVHALHHRGRRAVQHELRRLEAAPVTGHANGS